MVENVWLTLWLNIRAKPPLALLAPLAVGVMMANAGAAFADAKMDAAKGFLTEHRTVPPFVDPGPPFDAKACAAGKKMMSIPLSTTIPYEMATNKGMAAAAATVGLGYTTWSNQLKVDQWIAGINDAIGQKENLINLWSGLNPAVVAPQIAEARAAGVKVVSTDTYDYETTPTSIVDNGARVNHSMAAKLIATWSYVQTDGKPNVIIIGSDEIIATKPMVEAARATLKDLCPDCKVKYLNVSVPEWATKMQTELQSLLIANPDVNFVLPIYDSMVQFVVPALRVTNREGSVRIASADGTPYAIDLVRNGQLDMDVGSSLGWLGYAALDSALRVMCGLKPVEFLKTPFVIFDKSNAASAGIPASYDKGYGETHIPGFAKLWGLH